MARRAALRRGAGALDGRLSRRDRAVGGERHGAGSARCRISPTAAELDRSAPTPRKSSTSAAAVVRPRASNANEPQLAHLDTETFEAAFDATVANCQVLSRDEARHFVDKGYVVVHGSFSETFAAEVCQGAWNEMRDEHGVDEHDPEDMEQTVHRARTDGLHPHQGNGSKAGFEDRRTAGAPGASRRHRRSRPPARRRRKPRLAGRRDRQSRTAGAVPLGRHPGLGLPAGTRTDGTSAISSTPRSRAF